MDSTWSSVSGLPLGAACCDWLEASLDALADDALADASLAAELADEALDAASEEALAAASDEMLAAASEDTLAAASDEALA